MKYILRTLKERFEVKDLGKVSYLRGIEIKRDNHGITISQRSYINELLKRFNVEVAKTISTPMEVGIKFTKIKKLQVKAFKVLKFPIEN